MGRVKELYIEMMENGFELPLSGEKFVCAHHFQDPYLSAYVSEHSVEGTCTYCGRQGHVADMSDVISHIGFVVKMHFNSIDDENLPLASTFFDDSEEEIPGIKRLGCYAAPAGTDDYISTSDLLESLNVWTDNAALNEDLDNIFIDQSWIKKDAFEPWKNERMTWQWNRFSDLVKTSRRYTFWKFAPSDENEEPLIDILHDLGESIVVANLIKTLPVGTILFRVRSLSMVNQPYGFNDITSAPDGVGGQCRMSPAGVSMFYGAYDKETSLAESLKCSIHVANLVGMFRTKLPLRVVDLTLLPNYVSIWMNSWESVLFLKSFHADITQPIRDNKENIDYVPSQVFTEYLRWMFRDRDGSSIDGVVYQSCKTESKNIVLFCNQVKSAEWLQLDNYSVE